MTPLLDAARDLQAFCERQAWRFCFIGGLAVLRWGEPRLTRDVDATLLCPFGAEASFADTLLAGGYTARISGARDFAVRSRVILLQADNGTPIDVALGVLPFEERAIERSSVFEFDSGCPLRTCSAEDLLVMKLFAFRPRDILDAESVAIRQRGIDWTYVHANLCPLADIKAQPEIMATLERLRQL